MSPDRLRQDRSSTAREPEVRAKDVPEPPPSGLGKQRRRGQRVTQALAALGLETLRPGQLLWCGLHGLASLRIHKPDAPRETSPDVAAGALVAALSRGP